MIDYRLALAERSSAGLGTPIIEDVFGTIGVLRSSTVPLHYTDVHNGAGLIEFALPIDHPQVTTDNFDVGNRELHLYRDGVLVWGGKLWVADIRGWEVRFIGYGWYYDLTRREQGPDDFAMTDDQLTIVRTLVDATQALTGGDLGLTHYDLATSGVTRTMVVCAEERRQLSDIIEELAAADDGLDFAVLPTKALRMWYPRRGTATTVTFSGDENMSDFEYQIDATNIVTEVAGLGPQEACATPLVVTTDDGDALTKYGLLQGNVTSDTVDADLLAGLAAEELRTNLAPRWQPQVGVSTDLQAAVLNGVAFEDYEVGDAVTLETTRGAAGGFGYFNRAFRIATRDVTVTLPGIEVVKLELDSVVAA